jgi:hypothetical protein
MIRIPCKIQLEALILIGLNLMIKVKLKEDYKILEISKKDTVGD